MIIDAKNRRNRLEARGLVPLNDRFREIKTKLPADVWRMRSVAKRPTGNAVSDVILVVGSATTGGLGEWCWRWWSDRRRRWSALGGGWAGAR